MSAGFTVPVCATNPWPIELSACLDKFAVYNQRMKKLFTTRDKTAESPQPQEWSMTKGKTYTSTCLLWDILHVYHMLGVMHWNEGMKQLTVARDPKQAKIMFVESHKFFKSISEKILPRWNPPCRMVYQLFDGSTRSLVFPPFLIGNNWDSWCKLALAMIQKCALEKSLEESRPSLITKVATGGYDILNSVIETPEPKEIAQLIEAQKQVFKWYAILYWTKSDEDAEKVGIKIKSLKEVSSQMKKFNTTSLLGVTQELERWEKLNGSVYFQKLPDVYKESDLMAQLPRANLTTNIHSEMDCCVI